MPFPGDYQKYMRSPYQSELDYFNKNPHVAGMAAEDDRVILNPYSTLRPKEMEGVVLNEVSRLFMRKGKRPAFDLTDDQREFFKGYSNNEQDIRETIAARLFSGDRSAGNPTNEQLDYVNNYLRQALLQENE